jgi:crotonobetainyl-CoA:carnitine CoA-transferase CaiB-like acyl-CoA transferase
MNDTPPSYRLSPPLLGEHTDEVLSEVLGLSEDEIKKLKNEGVI